MKVNDPKEKSERLFICLMGNMQSYILTEVRAFSPSGFLAWGTLISTSAASHLGVDGRRVVAGKERGRNVGNKTKGQSIDNDNDALLCFRNAPSCRGVGM